MCVCGVFFFFFKWMKCFQQPFICMLMKEPFPPQLRQILVAVLSVSNLSQKTVKASQTLCELTCDSYSFAPDECFCKWVGLIQRVKWSARLQQYVTAVQNKLVIGCSPVLFLYDGCRCYGVTCPKNDVSNKHLVQRNICVCVCVYFSHTKHLCTLPWFASDASISDTKFT